MNRILLVLVALSLGANTWLIATRRGHPGDSASRGSETPPTPPAVGRAPAAGSAAAPATTADRAAGSLSERSGVVWRAPRADEDFRGLADDLRAAGFPSRLIHRVLSDLYLQQRLDESPLARAPHWQRLAVAPSAEMRAFQRAQRDRIAELLGPDGRPSARLNAVVRKRQYGDLSDAAIDAIAAIEADYLDLRSDVYRTTPPTMADMSSLQQQAGLIRTEMLADLAKVLSPAELANYQLHNSEASVRSASLVREVALTDDEFQQVADARRRFDEQNPIPSGGFSPQQMGQRLAAQEDYGERLRAALPDDRFYTVLERAEPGFRAILGLRNQFPHVTPSVAYDVLRLQYEAQRSRLGGASSPATTDWNARLEALVGSEAAAALRRIPAGFAFTSPGSRPAPPPRN